MALVLNTAATTEPVSLTEARLHLRVDANEDSVLIESLIKAATNQAQIFTHRQFINATWKLILDGFPTEIVVPRPPLSSVTSIQYVDTAGATQTLATAGYQVDTDTEPGRIREAYGQQWPSTRDEMGAVTVTYVAGYGATATSVPEDIKAAIKLLVAHWYENREPVVVGSTAVLLPLTVEALLMQRRAWWIYT